MSEEKFDSYDFLLNDDEEAMLLLYARENAPEKPNITINTETASAVLQRNQDDVLELEDIPEDVLEVLQDSDTLLVCELSREENEEDTQIIYAYEAEIKE